MRGSAKREDRRIFPFFAGAIHCPMCVRGKGKSFGVLRAKFVDNCLRSCLFYGHCFFRLIPIVALWVSEFERQNQSATIRNHFSFRCFHFSACIAYRRCIKGPGTWTVLLLCPEFRAYSQVPLPPRSYLAGANISEFRRQKAPITLGNHFFF